MTQNQTKTERTIDVITNDRPLGKQVPGAPFVVVALSYVALLGIAALALGVVLWLF